MLIIVGMLIMKENVKNLKIGELREQQIRAVIVNAFKAAGWKVREEKSACFDLIAERPEVTYLIAVKVSSEGRKDRLIPLWSQLFLQSSRLAAENNKTLAIVAAPRIAPSVARRILEFAATYTPEAAIGVVDLTGLQMFRGSFLDELNIEENRESRHSSVSVNSPTNLFSDLNQWMLKVLLAPELPEGLLTAPRNLYRNASELAEAANVSKMSSFRLIQQLRYEGYLDESASRLKLVRRQDLFRRWQSSVETPVKELPMRFILRSEPLKELKRLSRKTELCLGLFAAAEALHLGFVRGVPPYVYVKQLNLTDISKWKNTVPAGSNEPPDFILREPLACQSVFRGMVKIDDLNVCDILQIWLDVSSHPSRGQEQADLIRDRVLSPIIDEKNEND